MDISFQNIETAVSAHYSPKEYPALYSQLQRWSRQRPLAGLKILDASPVFRNTLTKYLPLLSAGASLSVGVSDMMPYDPEVVGLLRDMGMHIVSPGDMSYDLDLILDCGGVFSGTPARLGYVELTRSGTHRYTDHKQAVFIADSGKIKHIETLLGTGESLFRALRSLGHNDFEGKKLVVFGTGKVGSGIILYGNLAGMEITAVTDPQTVSIGTAARCSCIIDRMDRQAVAEALGNAFLIVTATGHADALGDAAVSIAAVGSQALLANMGVEDEFGPHVPSHRVLNSKRPLNFILKEPTHLKYIETTMALHNAGALYIVEHTDAAGIIDPPEQTENELLEVTRRNGLIGTELELIG